LIEKAAAPPECLERATIHTIFGDVLFAQGRNVEALSHLKKALYISETAKGPEHPSYGDAASTVALVQASLGNKGETVRYHDKAFLAWKKSFGEDVARRRLEKAKARSDQVSLNASSA